MDSSQLVKNGKSLVEAMGFWPSFRIGLMSLAAAIFGSFLFLSGVGGLLIDYLPTAPADAVAAAHERAYYSLFAGVLFMLISAALAGYAFRAARKVASVALFIVGVAAAFPLYLWLLG